MNSKKRKQFAVVFMLSFLAIIVLFGDKLVLNNPYESNLKLILKSPCIDYPFGTDNLGRCIFSRIMTGAKTSILSACIVILADFVIGISIGAVSGYLGGRLDSALMKVTVFVQSFPSFILVVAFTGILGPGLNNAILAIILIRWTTYAKLSRSLVLKIKEEPYIKAANICGANHIQVIFKYILPNMISILITTATLDVGNVILTVASLSFLGLGAQAPLIELGAMISSSREYLQMAIWFVGYTSFALFIVVMMFNIIGDSLRDLLSNREWEN